MYSAHHDKGKLGVIFVMLIFFGSSIGLALLYTPKTTTYPLPTSIVVYEPLEKDKKEYYISQGITIITFYHEKDCNQCSTLLSKFEGVASKFAPYVIIEYLEGDKTQITIKNKNNEQTITSINEQSLAEIICETIPPGTQQYSTCIDYKILKELEQEG